MSSFLIPFLKASKLSFKNFSNIISDPNMINKFLRDFGWSNYIDSTNLSNINNLFNLNDAIQELYELVDDLAINGNINEDDIQEIYNLIVSIYTTIDSYSSIQTVIKPFDNSDFWAQMKNDLPDYILIQYIKLYNKKLYGVLDFTQIIETILQTPTGSDRIKYKKQKISWENLKNLFLKPDKFFQNTYSYNKPGVNLNHKLLLERLNTLVSFIGIKSYLSLPIYDLATNYYSDTEIDTGEIRSLQIPIISSTQIKDGGFIEAGLNIMPIPKNSSSSIPSGFLISPIVSGSFEDEFRLGPNVKGVIEGNFNSSNSFGLSILPDKSDIIFNLQDTILNANFGLKFDYPEVKILLGSKNSTRLELREIELSINIQGTIDDPELVVKLGEGKTNNNPFISFILAPGVGDGFIKKITPKKGLKIDINSSLTWSSKFGLGFNNGLGFNYKKQLAHPNNTKNDIGFNVEAFTANITTKNNDIILGIGADIRVIIGALNIKVKNIGVSVKFDENNGSKGLFNNYNFNFGFLPPSGLAISVKSSTVSGGGFLDIDVPNHKYIGALELKIKKISLVAIGILKTKLPGGKDGYSLLMLITVEGFKPIQLGFGFALAGVGGLLGLNRTANLQSLRDGLKTGANQSILFPKNVIKNADKIISDLETCFPDKEGRFLVGPMAKIVWGAPKPLINIDLGLIIEVPAPLTIAILGVVRAALPDEKKPKFVININFLGTIEFDKKLISFDATIYDSKIMTFAISGDMAFRLKWGEQSNFLLSVGGFHPAYTPPPLNLPELRRISIKLVDKANFNVGLQAYFAITSNTVQIGAKVDAYAEHGKYNAIGILWLDVLFQFNPFYFIADMGAMVAIRKGSEEILSACLQATLQGPGPWIVRGTAEFKILKIGFKINFNAEFGDDIKEKIEDKDVWPELAEAIKHKDNWSTLLPERNQLFVNIKERATDAEKLYVHPLGKLAMSQVLAPMNFRLEKFGHVKPKDYKKFRVDSVKVETLNSSDVAIEFAPKKDKFSPAQFLELTDEQKLSRPSFEDMESGISIGTDNLVSSCMVISNLEYQKPRVIDRRMKQTLTDTYKENVEFANSVLMNSSVYKTFSNNIKNSVTEDAPSQTTLKTKEYAIANKETLSEYDSQRFFSIADAQAYVNQIIKTTPSQKNKLMVSETLELV